MMLAYYDVGNDAFGFQIRQLCVLISRGVERFSATLLAIDPETRATLVGHLATFARGEPRLADVVFDFAPARASELPEVARYNLELGRTSRATAQLRWMVEAYEDAAVRFPAEEHHLLHDWSYVASKLMLEALDARAAQRAGGSNR